MRTLFFDDKSVLDRTSDEFERQAVIIMTNETQAPISQLEVNTNEFNSLLRLYDHSAETTMRLCTPKAEEFSLAEVKEQVLSDSNAEYVEKQVVPATFNFDELSDMLPTRPRTIEVQRLSYSPAFLKMSYGNSHEQSALTVVDSNRVISIIKGTVEYKESDSIGGPYACNCYHEGNHVSTGTGQKKKEAKMAAAAGFINHLKITANNNEGIPREKGYCDVCNMVVVLAGHHFRCRVAPIGNYSKPAPIFIKSGDTLLKMMYSHLFQLYDRKDYLRYLTYSIVACETAPTQRVAFEAILGSTIIGKDHSVADMLEHFTITCPEVRRMVLLWYWEFIQTDEFESACAALKKEGNVPGY